MLSNDAFCIFYIFFAVENFTVGHLFGLLHKTIFLIAQKPPTLDQRKNIKLESRERSSEFRKLYEITGVVGVGGGGTVYAGKDRCIIICLQHQHCPGNAHYPSVRGHFGTIQGYFFLRKFFSKIFQFYLKVSVGMTGSRWRSNRCRRRRSSVGAASKAEWSRSSSNCWTKYPTVTKV